MKNLKAVLSVRFRSTYSSAELLDLFHQGLEDFKNVPGLLQRYYVADENSETVGGIYVFENRHDREAFCNSKLAKDIPSRYRLKMETLGVEELEVTIETMEIIAA